MTVVLSFSINDSFNPFTLSRPLLGARAKLASLGADGPPRARRPGRPGMRTAVSRRHAPRRSGDEILALLPALARVVDDVEADLRRWVVRLRDLGVGWDAIGASLGQSQEQARQRFEPGPEP
jgi:hypothetical protein